MMTRNEHLAWAKARAIRHTERGNVLTAWLMFLNDLGEHKELRNHGMLESAVQKVIDKEIDTPEKMRELVEGFE